jgi:hypothetical protein
VKTKKKRVKGIKKVNSAKVEYNGILFDSKLEIYCYKKLIESRLQFEYTKYKYVIVNPFTFDNLSYEPNKRSGDLLSKRTNKIKYISYTPDFVGKGWIIETKGRPNDQFPLRWKLFKKYLTDNNIKFDLYLPKNQKQVDQCIELISQKI